MWRSAKDRKAGKYKRLSRGRSRSLADTELRCDLNLSASFSCFYLLLAGQQSELK